MMRYLKQLCFLIVGFTILPGSTKADIQHLDDVIITFSQCVGSDCVNGESFGFDTVRLKENNLRINFQDTSTSASFPSNDWRIIANDSSNGGANYLGIEDSTSGRIPFRVEAGAPVNSLYVEDGGRIGIKTSTPVVDLHIKGGNTPTVRLEQDGSSGFTPQTWDMAGNEAGFFIRDATNGSKLSFRIEPGADASSVHIDSDGDVGFGTASPGLLTYGEQASLHVRRSDGNASLLIEETTATVAQRGMIEVRNSGGSYITLRNTETNDDWYVTTQNADNGSLFLDSIVDGAGDGAEFTLTTDGNLTLNGTITTAGSCSMGCDAVFNPDYDLPSIIEHANYMFENKHLEAVGPTPEEGAFNLTEKMGGMLNELEKAHIYIAELHTRLEELEKKLSDK